MSRSRTRGNALESLVAEIVHYADGMDPLYAPMQTPTGRVGNTYHLQTDVISKHGAFECKNREDNPMRLWDWLDKLAARWTGETSVRLGADKIPALVLKRNRRRPLVVLSLDDYVYLLERAYASK